MDAFERLGIDRHRGRSLSGADDEGDSLPLLALVVPDSAAAPPLRVTIDTGPFQLAGAGSGDDCSDLNADGSWGWGVRAAVEASTLFTLMAPNPSDEEAGRWANVSASFRTSFALPHACCTAGAAAAAAAAGTGRRRGDVAGAESGYMAREPLGAVLITASKR